MPSTSLLTALCFLLMIPLAVNTMDVSETNELQLVLLDKHHQKQFNGNIQNLLIHPSKNIFAEFILPCLSPNAILQMYRYFKKSNPNLDLPTFLEIYHFQSNILWILEEEYIFYPILENKSALIYSNKNQTPTILENVSYPDIRSGDILALLPSKNIIIPFQYRTFLNSRYGLIFAKNPEEGYDFFIALSKSNGKFSVVAHGAAQDINISQNIHLIWEAYTNNTFSSLKMKYIRRVTIPYLRYNHSCQVFYKNLYPEKCSLPRFVKLIFGFILFLFYYYSSILPFVSFLLPLDYLLQIELFTAIDTYLPGLIFIMVTWPFIGQLHKSVQPVLNLNLNGYFPRLCSIVPKFNLRTICPEQLNIFGIKPQKLMWKFPLLMQIQNPETIREKLAACWFFLTLHVLLFDLPFILFLIYGQ